MNSSSGIEFQLQHSDSGGNSLGAAKDSKKSLNRYSFLLIPGIFGGLLAWFIYPPLDAGPFVAFGLCVLFLPVMLQLGSFARNRLNEDVGRLRTAYIYSSLALAMLASLLLLNGWSDQSPRNVVRATVVRKTATRGKGGTQYVLTVSSWRPARSTEDFYVSSLEFKRAAVGKTVGVELHRGFLGLPWSGTVSPE
jgi:hypothetical protein